MSTLSRSKLLQAVDDDVRAPVQRQRQPAEAWLPTVREMPPGQPATLVFGRLVEQKLMDGTLVGVGKDRKPIVGSEGLRHSGEGLWVCQITERIVQFMN